MASRNPELTDGELIKLIYRHLKENGHKKAAKVLRKHAPQVETASVNVSLNDLFKKWMSEDKPQNRHAGEEQTLGSSKSSGPKPKKPTNAKRNISTVSKKKLETTAGSGNQKKKRTKKKEDSSSGQGQTDLTSKSPTADDDSDSDSSLDVEKWKRLAFEWSDVNIAKMDALTSSNSTGKKRKPAQTKKETSTNINGKPSAKKTKAKSAISPSKTKKTDKPSKPRSKKTSSTVTDKVKTPSKKTKDKGNLSEMDISNSLSEQAVIPKADGLSENDGIKHKSKKKKLKKAEKQCESINAETGTQSLGTEKPDNPSEPKQNKNPSKKGKSKINKSLEVGNVDTPSRGIETPVKKVKLKKAVGDLYTSPNQADTEVESSAKEKNDKLSDSTLIKTPSKKDKSKIKKSLGAGNVDTPRGAGTEIASITSESKKSEKTNDLPNGKPVETPVRKVKCKKSVKAVEAADLDSPPKQADAEFNSIDKVVNKSEKNYELSDSTPVKTPSKKAKSKKSAKPVEPGDVHTPSSEAAAMFNSRHVSSDQSETPSKGDQNKASGDETPSKKTKSKKAKEPVELDTPSGEGKAEEFNNPSKFDQLQSPSNKPETKKAKLSVVDPGAEEKLSKKVKAKKTDCISELNETETPAKVNPAVTSPKTPKHLTANNLSEAPISETPVKMPKTKKSPEFNQAVTPSNEASLDAEEPDKTKTSSKKKKSKTLDNEVQSEEIPSDIINQDTASEKKSCPSTQNKPKEKKRKSKDEDTVSVSILEEGPEPKKRKKDKKKKKEHDESAVEEVAPALQPEQMADSLASNPERKKKKKKKDKDVEKSVISSPASEEEPPKKKKKSSKEKEQHITDVVQEGQI